MSSFLPDKPTDESVVDAAFRCLLTGQYAEAWILLQNFLNSDRPDVLFNIGLCYMQAQNHQAAADCFEKSLAAIQRAGKMNPIKKDVSYIILRKLEIENKIYLQPITKVYIERFSETAKENVIMALSDAYIACGLHEKAKKLMNSLIGEEFAIFKNK